MYLVKCTLPNIYICITGG